LTFSFLIRMDISWFTELSTNRIGSEDVGLGYTDNLDTSSFFRYEGLVAALAVSFCRFTVKTPNEKIYVRLVLSALLGCLSFKRCEYWVLMSVHVWSYSQLFYIFFRKRITVKDTVKHVPNPYKESQGGNSALRVVKRYAYLIFAVLSAQLVLIYTIYSCSNPDGKNSFFQSSIYQLVLYPYILSTKSFHFLSSKFYDNISYIIPITEVLDAYNILIEFVQPKILHTQMSHVFYVTANIQVGMGFLGIGFLTTEQDRKNTLIRLEDEAPRSRNENEGPHVSIKNGKKREVVSPTKDISKKYNRGAASFIFFSALPYMFQLIFYGGVNMYTFHCFRDDLHRTVRLRGLFDSDGGRFVATASVDTNYRSPEEYATNMETVVTTVYDMVNGKLFSVPKLLLLPQIIAKQPMLMLKIFPFILMSDYFKSIIVARVTSEVERLSKKTQELQSMRTRVEQFDLKNSDLIQRSGYDAIPFTERKWVALTEKIQALSIRRALLNRSRMYFAWLQRNFVMIALVDCALAKLILIGKIVSRDIFVYQRAIEDAIDLLLMKSRAESELASMATSIDVLHDLKQTWSESEKRNLLNCSVNDVQDADHSLNGLLEIHDLAYTRGVAAVKIDNLVLEPAIYAVTGANGSGKSTLFQVIMSCDTNRKAINLDNSISIQKIASISMPSSDVIAISQNFYWPLFSVPVDWIYQINLDNDVTSNAKREQMITRVEDALQSLNFYQETQVLSVDDNSDTSTESATNLLRSDLTTEKEDWFGDLSGGQKSKVELVRKVFLAEECPKILLIDETFAPLDPDSKSLVMGKLKEFCSNSIVLVIYHADVKIDEAGVEAKEGSCVPSSDFFDNNLHVEDGSLSLRSVCID